VASTVVPLPATSPPAKSHGTSLICIVCVSTSAQPHLFVFNGAAAFNSSSFKLEPNAEMM
jgi:hypothetical protein